MLLQSDIDYIFKFLIVNIKHERRIKNKMDSCIFKFLIVNIKRKARYYVSDTPKVFKFLIVNIKLIDDISDFTAKAFFNSS